MKVLVANPPAYIGSRDRHFIQAGSRWSHSFFISKNQPPKDHYSPYPFFIGYSSALLKRDTDHEIKAIDACARDFDEHGFIDYVNKYNPDLLSVEVPTVSFPLVMDVLRKIKASNPNLKIALAGDHVTALTEEIMTSYPFIDYCLIGEYEISLKALLDALERESDLENLRGIAFRKGDGAAINERRELLRDLDFLPFPDRSDLHIEDYHDFGIRGEPCVQMRTARGCPFHCAFCAPRQVFYACPLYRKRKPEKVVDEMEICREKFHAKQVFFDDETMTRNHARQICEEIIGRKIDVPWACMGDVNLDLDTLQLMRRAGCVGVKFGIETIDSETLSHIGKEFVRAGKVEQFRGQCKKLGLWTHATYMVGLPSDTAEKVRATLKFAVKLDTESAQFAIATPLPGTPFFAEAREKGWLTTLKWAKYDGANFSVLNYPWFSKEKIEELYHWMCDSWRKYTGKRYLTHPIRTLKRARVIGLKRTARAIWSLKGTFGIRDFWGIARKFSTPNDVAEARHKSPASLKLDLGCGREKHEGCVGIDWSRENSDADIIHDLNDMPWPFADNSVDEAYASHSLEHLDDLTGALREIHRICKPGAMVHIRVPYCGNEGAFMLEHKWYFGTHALSYYCFGNYAPQGRFPRLFSLKRCGWNIIGTNLKHELLEYVVKALGGTRGVLHHLINELYFELEVVK